VAVLARLAYHGSCSGIKGQIQYSSAVFDVLFYGGFCADSYDIDALDMMYTGASAPKVYIQSGADHGLTLPRNASAGLALMWNSPSWHGLRMR